MQTLPAIDQYRGLIESALAYGNGTHAFEDVVAEVEAGTAQSWFGPNSCVITQLDDTPQKRVLHFFLASGVMAELEAMVPGILEWGKEQGCVSARFCGRKGWERSFLSATGWANSGHIIMERDL